MLRINYLTTNTMNMVHVLRVYVCTIAQKLVFRQNEYIFSHDNRSQ